MPRSPTDRVIAAFYLALDHVPSAGAAVAAGNVEILVFEECDRHGSADRKSDTVELSLHNAHLARGVATSGRQTWLVRLPGVPRRPELRYHAILDHLSARQTMKWLSIDPPQRFALLRAPALSGLAIALVLVACNRGDKDLEAKY